jgi:serine/threonine protein phosphatase 1
MLDDGHRLYVIGDIHGRSDLLDRIIGEIKRDLDARPPAAASTITLGDYIDRGPDSRGVLDRLAGGGLPTHHIALKGNHEELFQSFLASPAVGAQWRHLGGLETLHSYGVSVAQVMRGKGFEEASTALRQAVPDEHLRFIAELKLCVTVNGYFFCHAGVRPGVALERQQAKDLLWIRDEFLRSKFSFGKVVVHGHSPVEEPEVLPNRINLDTGAFITGRLTCLVLDGSARRFIVAT